MLTTKGFFLFPEKVPNTLKIVSFSTQIEKRKIKTKGYWDEFENITNFLNDLQKEYNVESPSDWKNKISRKNIKSFGGGSLLNKYSLLELKKISYPNLIFDEKPQRETKFWDSESNIHNFILELKNSYNLNTVEDWKLLTQKQVKQLNGACLLKKHSLFEIKALGCPEIKLKYPDSEQKPSGFWNNETNIRNFLHKVKEENNIQSIEDWNNKISMKIIKNNGGISLFSKYSLQKLGEFAFSNNIHVDKNRNDQKPSGYWNNHENIQNFIDLVKNTYDIQTMEDWNSISRKQIINLGGASLLSKFSLFGFKSMACPEIKSNFIHLKHKPRGFWDKQENIHSFIDLVKKKYNINTKDDWDKITVKDIYNLGGGSIITKYSLFELKKIAFSKSNYPLYQKPRGYWNNKENIKNFMFEIKEKYNIVSTKDWLNISQSHIQLHGGSKLLKKYSLFDLISEVCPEFKEKYFYLERKPIGYWKKTENIENFISFVSDKLNIKTPEDCNKLSKQDIVDLGGKSLFDKFSLFEIKSMIIPSLEYKNNKPKGYWNDKDNIMNFLSFAEKKLNIKSPKDWESVSQDHIRLLGGSSLLVKFSLLDIKRLAQPEYFLNYQYAAPKPNGYWDRIENIRAFLEEIKEKFQIQSTQDWNRISRKQIELHGGSRLLFKYSIGELLSIAYPEVNWDKALISKKDKRASQRWLFLQVQKLFPDEEMIEDYFHGELTRLSGFAIQFDIFIPKRNIAIEYHGKQHFVDFPATFGSLELYKSRDNEKQKICKLKDITLIVIPYWWDNKFDSLKETLHSYVNKTI